MKIIIVGASGTMGKHLTSVFKKEHEVITAATKWSGRRFCKSCGY